MGLLETTRGRGGGLRLLQPAQAIVVGQVVRQTETDFTLVECFDPEHNSCRLDGHCRLKTALREAMNRYLEVLDGVTLADLIAPMPVARGQRVQFLPSLPRPPEGAVRRPRVSAGGESR